MKEEFIHRASPHYRDEKATKITSHRLRVVVSAHNEEEYLAQCLTSIFDALPEADVLVILDRCTDKSYEVASRFRVRTVVKEKATWKNSHAEFLQEAFENTEKEFIAVIDADTVIPRDFFSSLMVRLQDPKVASASGIAVTGGPGVLNALVRFWERTYSINLGREPRGLARVYRRSAVRSVGGWMDKIAQETDLDMRLENSGWKNILDDEIKVIHIRRLTIEKIMSNQIKSGRARYQLRLPKWRIFGHSIVRLRPLVALGYILEALGK